MYVTGSSFIHNVALSAGGVLYLKIVPGVLSSVDVHSLKICEPIFGNNCSGNQTGHYEDQYGSEPTNLSLTSVPEVYFPGIPIPLTASVLDIFNYSSVDHSDHSPSLRSSCSSLNSISQSFWNNGTLSFNFTILNTNKTCWLVVFLNHDGQIDLFGNYTLVSGVCPPGYGLEDVCVPCPNGTYAIQPMSTCQQCPQTSVKLNQCITSDISTNMVHFGKGLSVAPYKAFKAGILNNTSKFELVPCRHCENLTCYTKYVGNHSLGVTCNYYTLCPSGRSERLCSKCENNTYLSANKMDCKQCAFWKDDIIILLSSITFVILCFIILILSLHFLDRTLSGLIIITIFLISFIFHITLLITLNQSYFWLEIFLLGTFLLFLGRNHSRPCYYTNFFYLVQSLAFIHSYNVSLELSEETQNELSVFVRVFNLQFSLFDCFWPGLEQYGTTVEMVVFTVFVPAIIIIGYTIQFIVSYFHLGKTPLFKYKCLYIVLFILNFIYFPMFFYIIKIFGYRSENFMNEDNSMDQYLIFYPWVEWWGESNLNFIWWSILPTLFVVLFPFCLMVLLKKNSDNRVDVGIYTSFIYDKYRYKLWWFEFIYILQRLLFMISVLVVSSITMSNLVLSLLLSISLLIISYSKPFPTQVIEMCGISFEFGVGNLGYILVTLRFSVGCMLGPWGGTQEWSFSDSWGSMFIMIFEDVLFVLFLCFIVWPLMEKVFMKWRGMEQVESGTDAETWLSPEERLNSNLVGGDDDPSSSSATLLSPNYEKGGENRMVDTLIGGDDDPSGSSANLLPPNYEKGGENCMVDTLVFPHKESKRKK